MMLKFHTQTGGVTLTSIEPMNNIIRVTLQALAAVLENSISIQILLMSFSPLTEESVRIALRTQQIIAYESGVTDSVDPRICAYFIESLTDEIEKRAFEIIDRIGEYGWNEKCNTPWTFKMRYLNQHTTSKEVEDGERIIVGKNKFRVEEDKEIKRFKVNEKVLQERVEKLEYFRKNRDFNETSTSLKILKEKRKNRCKSYAIYS